MAIESIDWLHHDIRDYMALTRFILFKCCKKAEKEYQLGKDIDGWEKSVITKYIPIDFMDFKWIVDRCNFKMSKDYGVNYLPNSYLSWYEEAHFVPEYFDADFSCDYKKLKNGKWKKIQSNNEECDFVSGAEMYVAKKMIRRWKIYGKWFVKFDNFWWKITNKFRKK